MSILYNVDPKTLLKKRNEIFVQKGIPPLVANRFEKSPFSSSWYGKNNLNDFTYEFCRLSSGLLEYVTTDIILGDRYIQIFLNIFKLNPEPKSVIELTGKNGLNFHIPPCSTTRIRLRIDDNPTIPIFRTKEHKIGTYFTKAGFENELSELSELIENDMSDIDYFIQKWHKINNPIVTDWEGNPLSNAD